jgi:hypothetical protein
MGSSTRASQVLHEADLRRLEERVLAAGGEMQACESCGKGEESDTFKRPALLQYTLDIVGCDLDRRDHSYGCRENHDEPNASCVQNFHTRKKQFI